MKKLTELADIVRSKNSGPFELTFDIIFKTEEIFTEVYENELITKDIFAKLYNIKIEDITKITYYPPAKAVKITIIRPISSGALGETDVYGAGLHRPLLNLSLNLSKY